MLNPCLSAKTQIQQQIMAIPSSAALAAARQDLTGVQIHQSSSGGQHAICPSEVRAFAEYITDVLGGDPELQQAGLVPILPPERLFDVCRNGVLLCKFVNVVKPGSIPLSAIKTQPRNTFEVLGNHKHTLSTCHQLGLKIVNIAPLDLAEGPPYLLLAVIWQLIRFHLLSKVSVTVHPELSRLIEQGESVDHFAKLPAEVNLLRWVNFHLAQAGSRRRIYNFGDDIKDSEAYTILLHQLAPQACGTELLAEPDPVRRADYMLQGADRIGCRKFVTPRDVAEGNEKLNLAFVATLFEHHPGLAAPSDDLERHRAAEIEAAVRQRMANEEAEFRRKLELERQRFEEEMREQLKEMEKGARSAWMQEEDAKRNFLEEEAKKIAAERQRLEAERAHLQRQQEDHDAQLRQQAADAERIRQQQQTMYQPSTVMTIDDSGPPPPVPPKVVAAVPSYYAPPPPAAAYAPVAPSIYGAPMASYYPPPPPQPSFYPMAQPSVYMSPPVAYTSTGYIQPPPVVTQQTVTSMWGGGRQVLGLLRICIEEGRNLVKKDFFGLARSDPYCIAQIRDQRHVTRKCKGETNPVWYEDLVFRDIKPGDELVIAIWDSDRFKKDDFMGEVRIHAKDFPLGQLWLPLKARHGHHDRVTGELRLGFSII